MNQSQPVNNQQQRYVEEDEIDLFELWQGLVEEKMTVILTFLVVVVGAAWYAFTAKPTYQATTYLLPPLVEKVLPMNQLNLLFNTNTNTPKSVFTTFRKNLTSRQNLQAIYQQYHLSGIYAPNLASLKGVQKKVASLKAFSSFLKAFKVTKTKKSNTQDGISAQLALTLSPEKTAEILNQLIERARHQTIQQIDKSIVTEKNIHIKNLNNKIASARKIEKDKRLDRIQRLDDAIEISTKVGIKDTVKTINTAQSMPLYLMGSRILKAERAVLMARKSDDPFIKGLRGWQEQLNLLNLASINSAKFGVVKVDETASVAEKIKPKKSLILAVAGVTGLILGIFIAFIRRAFREHRAETSAKEA